MSTPQYEKIIRYDLLNDTINRSRQAIENGRRLMTAHDSLHAMHATREADADAPLVYLPPGKLFSIVMKPHHRVTINTPLIVEGTRTPARYDWLPCDTRKFGVAEGVRKIFVGTTISYPSTRVEVAGYKKTRDDILATVKLSGAPNTSGETPLYDYQLHLGESMLRDLTIVDAASIVEETQFWPFPALTPETNPK